MINDDSSSALPQHFFCPLTLDVMADPVRHKTTGHTYEKEAIFEWMDMDYDNATCPLTRQPLKYDDLEDNVQLKNEIELWMVVVQSIKAQDSTTCQDDIINHVDRLLGTRSRVLARREQKIKAQQQQQ